MACRAVSNSLSAAAARPISSNEFMNALFTTWQRRRAYDRRIGTVFGMAEQLIVFGILIKNLLGLAISGGVDSMALAALFDKMQQQSHASLLSELPPNLAEVAELVLRDLRFKAFIVDHGVREGSGAEAKQVSSVLEERGNEHSFRIKSKKRS